MAGKRRSRPDPARKRTTAKLVGAGDTHYGHVRSENQDVVVVRPELGLYAVLDGMGGGPAGDVAAQLASEVIKPPARLNGFARRSASTILGSSSRKRGRLRLPPLRLPPLRLPPSKNAP